MIIIIWNIIKNIKKIQNCKENISQTDQKKQPCLAAKACQLRDKNQFCIRESLKIESYNRMRGLVKN